MKNIKKYLILATLIPVLVLSLGAIAKADNENGNSGRGNNNSNNNGQNRGDDDEDDEDSRRRATGSTLEVHITDKGKVLVRGARVASIAGNTITATTTFGSNALSWTVSTTDSTKFIRKNGGASSVSEVQVGDFMSFSGTLNTGATGLAVNATIIKDWSISQAGNTSYSGTIASIDATNKSFVLTRNQNLGNMTVTTTDSTVFKKGSMTIVFADLVVGDKVDKAEGLYNSTNNTLAASSVKMRSSDTQDAQVYEGKLQSIAGTTAPTSFVLKVGDTNYTVNVPVGISILGKNWLVIPLSSLQVNDKIRVYGTLTGTTIEASVVRDTDR